MLVVEGVLPVFLVCPPRRLNAEDQVVFFDSNQRELVLTNERAVEPQILIADSLVLALAKDLASIPEVRHVLAGKADDSLPIWVTVENAEPAVRRRIYQKELELITNFPEINFDFNLVPTMGREISEIVTDARVVFSRPE